MASATFNQFNTMSIVQLPLFGGGQRDRRNRRTNSRTRRTINAPRLPYVHNLQDAILTWAESQFLRNRPINREDTKRWVRRQDLGVRGNGSISGSLTIMFQRGDLGKLYRRGINRLTGRLLHQYTIPEGADLINQRDSILAHMITSSGMDTNDVREICDTIDRLGEEHFPSPLSFRDEDDPLGPIDWDALVAHLRDDDDDDEPQPSKCPF